MNTQRIFCARFVAVAFTRLGLGIIVALSAASAAHAMNKTWMVGFSGNFTGPSNWNPSGAPGATDQATFSAVGTYTVTFNNSPNPLPNPVLNQDLFFSAGNATFTSGTGGPFTYRLTGAGGSDANITGGTLTLGIGINPLNLTVDDDLVVRGGATLNVNNGSVVNTLDLVLAQAVGGGSGTINVDGSGSALNVTDSTSQSLGLNGNPATLTFRNTSIGSISGPLDVGGSSSGALNVLSGAHPNVGNLSVGSGTGTGTVNINDSASTLTQSGASTLTIGAASVGTGTVNIGTTATGGTLTTGSGLFTINKTGTVSVGSATTTGTLNANGNVTIDGGVLQVLNPASSFALASGKALTIQNGGQAIFDPNSSYTTASNAVYNVNGTNSNWVTHKLDVENGATINIGATASGGLVSIDNNSGVTLKIGATATVNIGSTTTTGNLQWGHNATIEGVLQVNSGSSASNIETFCNPVFGSVCYVTVDNGGRATFDLGGGSYTTQSNTNYVITGTNSKMELVNVSTMDIEEASVSVLSGGSLSVAGVVYVGSSGSSTLTIDGGTVTAASIQTANFISGTVGITGAAGVSLGATNALLGTNFSVDSNHNLNVTNATTIPIGSILTIDGGTFNTGSLVVNGSFTFNSGTLGITGPAGLTVGAGGLFGSALILTASQTWHVTNTLTVNAGAKLIAVSVGGLSAGNLVNNGDLVVVDSAINAPVVNNHAVTVVGSVDFNSLVSGPGGFFGPGTAHFNGGLAPGASPANVSFEGSLALADTNTLFIEIGGTTPGGQYDRLTIAGSATLDGNLNLSLINGFTPSGGQQFTILTAGSIIDNGFVLTGSAASLFNMVVSGTSVMLQAIGLAGDYNHNGIVDAADYTIWRDTLGSTTDLRANGDNTGASAGKIDQADYNVWKANFGNHAGSGAGATTSVPEPATLLPFLVGILTMCCRRRQTVP
jgi:hypothetical protein